MTDTKEDRVYLYSTILKKYHRKGYCAGLTKSRKNAELYARHVAEDTVKRAGGSGLEIVELD